MTRVESNVVAMEKRVLVGPAGGVSIGPAPGGVSPGPNPGGVVAGPNPGGGTTGPAPGGGGVFSCAFYFNAAKGFTKYPERSMKPTY